MNSLLLFFCLIGATQAQIKTSGIKTSGVTTLYPSIGNLVAGNATEIHNSTSAYNNNYHGYDNFVPAETYRGEPLPTRKPYVFVDPITEFINKTRSTMASGICHKEVPTASLVRDPSLADSGNGTSPGMSRIQVCCTGYERNPHIFARCDPICDDGCRNGICTAPNTCVCIPGHVRNYDNKCITICPLGCGNGVCDEKGECRCNPGYTLEPTEGKFCIPHCDIDCQFGRCVAPNKCDCSEGYRLDASGACEPKCDNCENGRCTAPGVCVCEKGYEKINGLCEPICNPGCEKGRCIAPNTCACPSGLDLDHSGFKCIPHCDLPCLNGVCAGGNTCTCNQGYIPDENQKNVCRAYCADGCPNGVCSAPNLCLCKPGYKKSGIKGRQTCMAV